MVERQNRDTDQAIEVNESLRVYTVFRTVLRIRLPPGRSGFF